MPKAIVTRSALTPEINCNQSMFPLIILSHMVCHSKYTTILQFNQRRCKSWDYNFLTFHISVLRTRTLSVLSCTDIHVVKLDCSPCGNIFLVTTTVIFLFASSHTCDNVHIHRCLCYSCRITEVPNHDDVIKWKHFPRYWPFVRGIHRWPMNSPQKGQWCEALMLSLISAWINGWVNNREAGDLRRHCVYYDVIVMDLEIPAAILMICSWPLGCT